MFVGEVQKPLSLGCRVAGWLFVIYGVAVWLYWMEYGQTQGVIRLKPTIERGEEVLRPHVYYARPGNGQISFFYPPRASLPLRFHDGDTVTVLLLPKGTAVVKPRVSIWKSPPTDFVLGGILLFVGWGFSRRPVGSNSDVKFMAEPCQDRA